MDFATIPVTHCTRLPDLVELADMAATPLPLSDESYTQEPLFSGDERTITTPFGSKADALDYARGVVDKVLDPFLGQTWSQIDVYQPRGPGGQFLKGWAVDVSYVRPGPDDDYALVEAVLATS
mgnify:CR=1 FL=1